MDIARRLSSKDDGICTPFTTQIQMNHHAYVRYRNYYSIFVLFGKAIKFVKYYLIIQFQAIRITFETFYYLEWCIGDTLGGAIVWFWTSDAKFDANLPMSQWLDSQDKGSTDWSNSN